MKGLILKFLLMTFGVTLPTWAIYHHFSAPKTSHPIPVSELSPPQKDITSVSPSYVSPTQNSTAPSTFFSALPKVGKFTLRGEDSSKLENPTSSREASRPIGEIPSYALPSFTGAFFQEATPSGQFISPPAFPRSSPQNPPSLGLQPTGGDTTLAPSSPPPSSSASGPTAISGGGLPSPRVLPGPTPSNPPAVGSQVFALQGGGSEKKSNGGENERSLNPLNSAGNSNSSSPGSVNSQNNPPGQALAFREHSPEGSDPAPRSIAKKQGKGGPLGLEEGQISAESFAVTSDQLPAGEIALLSGGGQTGPTMTTMSLTISGDGQSAPPLSDGQTQDLATNAPMRPGNEAAGNEVAKLLSIKLLPSKDIKDSGCFAGITKTNLVAAVLGGEPTTKPKVTIQIGEAEKGPWRDSSEFETGSHGDCGFELTGYRAKVLEDGTCKTYVRVKASYNYNNIHYSSDDEDPNNTFPCPESVSISLTKAEPMLNLIPKILPKK